MPDLPTRLPSRVAVHEAAHTIAAVALGWAPAWLRVRPAGRCRVRPPRELSVGGAATIDYQEAAILYAAAEAEEQILGLQADTITGGDAARLHEIGRRVFGPSWDGSWPRAEDLAARLVRRNRERIIRLARHLDECGRLSGADVRHLLGPRDQSWLPARAGS